jgi:O-glycosyl hydrolase
MTMLNMRPLAAAVKHRQAVFADGLRQYLLFEAAAGVPTTAIVVRVVVDDDNDWVRWNADGSVETLNGRRP